MSSRRFVELVVFARRFVLPGSRDAASRSTRATGRRQIGGEIAQFSFRLAFMIDLVYVSAGAVGGAALRTAVEAPPGGSDSAIACPARATPRPSHPSTEAGSAPSAALILR